MPFGQMVAGLGSGTPGMGASAKKERVNYN